MGSHLPLIDLRGKSWKDNMDDKSGDEAMREAEAAKALAEHDNAAKDHFLAWLSHELRTPLTPVVAALLNLQQQPHFDAETRQYLEVIRRNIELEIRLIDDLLDLTRINRGKIEVDKRLVELGGIVNRAVEVCRPDIESRHLSFEVDIKQPPHFVHADSVRLQQIFWNLIKNAIKFTPAGGKIRVRGWRENGQVLVEIRDNGIGIEAAALGRIFKAFEQLDRSTTRRFGGLGLGLAISKAMAELHGGRIEAQERWKGPRSNVHGAVADCPCRIDIVAGITRRNGSAVAKARRLKILLVEDHQTARRC